MMRRRFREMRETEQREVRRIFSDSERPIISEQPCRLSKEEVDMKFDIIMGDDKIPIYNDSERPNIYEQPCRLSREEANRKFAALFE